MISRTGPAGREISRIEFTHALHAWRIKSGKSAVEDADGKIMDRFVTMLRELKVNRFVPSDTPANLKAFGFEKPSLRITLRNARLYALWCE